MILCRTCREGTDGEIPLPFCQSFMAAQLSADKKRTEYESCAFYRPVKPVEKPAEVEREARPGELF
jgi:hypothetical protein